MKMIQLLFIGMITASVVCAQEPNTSFRFTENSKELIKANNIKTEEVYSYTFNESRIKDSVLIVIRTYDSLGDLVEERAPKTKKNKGGAINFRYTYDPKGNLIKKTAEDPEMKTMMTYEYDYDEMGREVNKYRFDKDTTSLTIDQKIYNTDNQVVKLATKGGNTDFYVSNQYYYNEDKKLAKDEKLNSKGTIIYTTLHEYDKSMNKETIYMQNDSRKDLMIVCYYNDSDLPVKTLSNFRKTADEEKDLNQIRESVFNKDRTVYQTSITINEKKEILMRHYYTKF